MEQFAQTCKFIFANLIELFCLCCMALVSIYEYKCSYSRQFKTIRITCWLLMGLYQALVVQKSYVLCIIAVIIIIVSRRLVVPAITGGIGSGKSTLGTHLSERGFVVVDADQINRGLLVPGAAAYDDLISKFGCGIVLANGEIDRDTLREIVFADENKRRLLNKCLHWHIGLAIIWQVGFIVLAGARLGADYKVPTFQLEASLLEIPLLYKSPLEILCGPVILLVADRETRIRRCRERNPLLTEAMLTNIINSQPRTRDLIEWADLVIENKGNFEDMFNKAHEVLASVGIQCE